MTETSAVAETMTLADCLTARATALSETPQMRDAFQRAAPRVPAAALAAALAQWQAAFGEILKIPVGEMFKAASLKISGGTPTVASDAAAKGQAGGETLVSLLPFVIESSHHPTIVVTCAAVSVTMRFDLEISLEVDGAQLRAVDDRFVGARTGTARGVVRITFLNQDPPLEMGSPEFVLPGVVDFMSPARRRLSARSGG